MLVDAQDNTAVETRLVDALAREEAQTALIEQLRGKLDVSAN